NLQRPNSNRPSRPSAAGVLARVYLYMGNYDQALLYAEQCLSYHDRLLDFNEISMTSTPPLDHDECLYQAAMGPGYTLTRQRNRSVYIDTSLIAMYQPGDLRKDFFFFPVEESPYYMINLGYSG